MRINFKINIPEDIHIISWIFKNNGYELMLVGGCVRDSFLNESVKDYDLVTNAIPDKIIELLKDEPIVTNIIETGKQFGVVNVITENGEYEIATFRSDGEYSDNRRPDSVVFGTIEQDCLRRDLTINALYYDLETNEIIDLVGGLDDLKNKIIRTVGKAEDRIKEDGLRSMRIIRFAARFSSLIDVETDKVLISNPNLIKISKERIRDEFIKGIKSAKSQYYFLKLIQKYKLFKYIFNDLKINECFIDENDYIILISYILKDNQIPDINKELHSLTYTLDEINKIKFLIFLNKLNIDNVFTLKKTQKNTLLTNEQIYKFGKLIKLDEKLLNAFISYELSITGQYIMETYNISQGKEVGYLIYEFETQAFMKLLS